MSHHSRFHAVYWPAILIASGLEEFLPQRMITHGHWTINGHKMSKSSGNVIDPLSLIESKFTNNPDPLRYFLLRTGRLDGDGDFNEAALESCYQRELVGSLGNLISRSRITEGTTNFPIEPSISEAIESFQKQVSRHYDNAYFGGVADCLQELLGVGNRFISQQEPWRFPDRWPTCQASINALLATVAHASSPLIPQTAHKIGEILQGRQSLSKGGIFPRLPRLQR